MIHHNTTSHMANQIPLEEFEVIFATPQERSHRLVPLLLKGDGRSYMKATAAPFCNNRVIASMKGKFAVLAGWH